MQPFIVVSDPRPHSAALNMALDEALLLHLTTAVLRVYQWHRPAISFGYFGRHEAVRTQWPKWELVRRMTGGGVVAHGADITYTIAAPSQHPLARMSAAESYRYVHGRIADWLAARAVGSELAANQQPGNGVCFESPVAGDVVAAGRKLAGAAQRRTREGLLLQGSIQSIPVTWRTELHQAFETSGDRDFTAAELATAERLGAEKYSREEWLRRV